jgi:hypothetical protein
MEYSFIICLFMEFMYKFQGYLFVVFCLHHLKSPLLDVNLVKYGTVYSGGRNVILSLFAVRKSPYKN